MKKVLFSLLLPLLFFVVPQPASAANLLLLNGSDSIVPTACRSSCPCGVGGALQFVQNIMNVMISIAVIFMVMFIVWAGFLFIMSAANPESRSKARSMLINAVIGMFIVLAAWLIVDFVMKTLYDPSAKKFGPWNQILQVDGNTCIDPQTVSPITGLPGVIGATVNNGVQGIPGGGGGGSAVSTLSAQQAAKNLLSNPNVSLGTDSGQNCPGGNASARENLQQVAAGKGMTRCPCGGGGSVAPSETLLNGLVSIANTGARIRVNYIAGACHSSGSNHYSGQAADLQKTSTLDVFFRQYPVVNTGTYKIGGVGVWFENSSHYHVSPTGR